MQQATAQLDVYTNRADWINAATESDALIFGETFDNTPTNFTLPAGDTDVADFMTFNVQAEVEFQGFFEDAITKEGQYFIGFVNDDNEEITLKNFVQEPTFAFGADWIEAAPRENQESLVILVNGQTINFRDHLTPPPTVTDRQFLGFISQGDTFDEIILGRDIIVDGEQFIMDDVVIGVEQSASFDFSKF